jgi:hypothetical protein
VDKEKLITALVEALDLDEFTEGYRRRLQIFDSQIEAFREIEKAYQQKLADMDEAINHLKAVCSICSRLNILCANPGERKEQGPDDEKDINKKLTNWH